MASLSMPLFVEVDDVIRRMQLSEELTGVVETVTSGIIGAQLHVERVIDGKLSRQSHSRVYHLDSDVFSGIQPGGMYRLEVPSGMIRQDTPIVLSNSGSSRLGPFETFDSLTNDFAKVDYDRGYVLVSASQYDNDFIRLVGDSGYEDGTTPYPLTGVEAYGDVLIYEVGDVVSLGGVAYTCIVETSVGMSPTTNPERWARKYVPMEDIPTDLKEAIITMVPVILSSSQQHTKGMPDPAKAYQRAAAHAELLLSNYTRAKGFTFRPLW